MQHTMFLLTRCTCRTTCPALQRQLQFDVVKMNVGLGPLRFSIPFKSDPKTVQDMDSRWGWLVAVGGLLAVWGWGWG